MLVTFVIFTITPDLQPADKQILTAMHTSLTTPLPPSSSPGFGLQPADQRFLLDQRAAQPPRRTQRLAPRRHVSVFEIIVAYKQDRLGRTLFATLMTHAWHTCPVAGARLGRLGQACNVCNYVGCVPRFDSISGQQSTYKSKRVFASFGLQVDDWPRRSLC